MQEHTNEIYVHSSIGPVEAYLPHVHASHDQHLAEHRNDHGFNSVVIFPLL